MIHQLQSNKVNPQYVNTVQLPPVQAGQAHVQSAEGKKRVNFNEGKLEELRTAKEAENQVQNTSLSL